MPAIRHRRSRRLGACALAVAAALLTLAAVVAPATAGATTAPSYSKYYVAGASYQGKPENVTEIATRFLGSASRGDEIMQLNSGVVQPDGGRLTNPDVVHAGWVILLPWDAYGDGVQYGLPPTAPPSKAPARSTASPTSRAQPPGVVSKPSAHATASPTPSTKPGACAGTPRSTGTSQSQWAMLRMAPEHAWSYTRGAGVTVAIVDSGVDASRPELSGHVTTGADIVTGSGRGDTDCLGTGTAMAGIIAARSQSGGQSGMAPDATVLPVRVAGTNAKVAEADQASAIQVAASTGAKVIALGASINPALPTVASAIKLAADHDVVVIGGAPQQSGPSARRSAGTTSEGLLRVAAMTIDGALAGRYVPGTVDVTAPGADVASIGISGTGTVQGSGTQYAVAFVAGEAALVRSMYPNLTAAQVVRRIEATADRMGSAVPDQIYGWGLIDPWISITRVIPDEGRGPGAAAAGSNPWTLPRTQALIIVLVLALVMVVLLVLRIRNVVRRAPMVEQAGGIQPDPGAQPRPEQADQPAVAGPGIGLTEPSLVATAGTDRTPGTAAGVPTSAQAGVPTSAQAGVPTWAQAGVSAAASAAAGTGVQASDVDNRRAGAIGGDRSASRDPRHAVDGE